MADQQISMFADEAPRSGKTISFSLSKVMHASAQQVFDRWLIPVFLEAWLFGKHTGDDSIVKLDNTVRKGGEFAFVVKRGKQNVCYLGVYEELDIPRRLAFSWQEDDNSADRYRVDVEFNAEGERTKLRLQATIPEHLAAQRDAIKQIWLDRCNALAACFKK